MLREWSQYILHDRVNAIHCSVLSYLNIFLHAVAKPTHVVDILHAVARYSHVLNNHLVLYHLVVYFRMKGFDNLHAGEELVWNAVEDGVVHGLQIWVRYNGFFFGSFDFVSIGFG